MSLKECLSYVKARFMARYIVSCENCGHVADGRLFGLVSITYCPYCGRRTLCRIKIVGDDYTPRGQESFVHLVNEKGQNHEN